MLHWSLTFFLAALGAALFGFTPMAAGPSGTAQALFFILLACFVTSFVAALFRVRRRLLGMARVRTDPRSEGQVTGGLSR